MGKEWHFGGRSSSSRRACDATVDHHRRRHHPTLPGCMSTLFRLFDFHSFHFTHFVFNKHHPSSFDLSHHRPLSKASHHGVELASRNSLKLDDASISCLGNKEKNLQIQMGLQVKTSKNGSQKSKSSDQNHPNIDHIASDSPSAKTPNILARLMGLDILPQTSSPSSSYRRGPKSGACHHVSGTRSLPESPRVSSSRLSDVDRHHHRLSLHEENVEVCKEIKREGEKVRRKVALVDITNNDKIRLEYGKREVGFSRSKVEKSSKRQKKAEVDEFNSKLKNQEAMMCRKRKPMSTSMSMWMRRPKAKAREEEETFGCPTTRSNDLLNNLNRPTKFSARKEPSPPAAKAARHEQQLESRAGGGVEEPTRQRWNRRLDESVLGEILKKKSSSWHVRRRSLAGEVRRGFPRGNCQVLEDMDALIMDKDLGKWKNFEIQGIARLVEFHILDSLLRETAAAIFSQQKRCRFHPT